MKHSYTNFRDLGGLECADSLKIKSGMIFRSPVLNTKSNEDIKFLESLNLNSIIDLRCIEEVRKRPDPEIKNCKYIFAPVFDGKKYKYIVVTNMGKIRCITLRGKKVGALRQNKIDSYEEMPFSKAYNKVFECMDRGERFVFHCTEGKDRTGICAFLIEYSLGRSESEIRKEYLLSNKFRPNKDRSKLKYLGLPQQLINDISFAESTHDDLLDLAENAILKKYSSFDEYLEKEFGVTEERRNRWRETYLEKNVNP
ncbi:MAG: tyrosine-protein phosphatase [Ruminococcus sp.]|nr:tyrosine-protein phosphatase [Candidatus Copronaster equi]